MSYQSFEYYPPPGLPFFDSLPQAMEPRIPSTHSTQDQRDLSGGVLVNGTTFPDEVSFQIPHFVYSAAPTIPTGGGVEVFPLGMPPQGSWMPFSRYQDNSASKTIQQEPTTYDRPQDNSPSSFAGAFDYEEHLAAPVPTNPPPRTNLLLSPASHFLVGSGTFGSSPSSSEPNAEKRPPHRALPPEAPIADVPAASLASLPPPPSVSTAASTLGLPIYSASGFDLLSILARVATRPYPRVQLGPVDMTCSFVVVDTRRHDHPIVYCSPNFLKLTGYEESEILGRNCRFLQSPSGEMAKGAPRPDPPSQAAATQMRRCLDADKECQIMITNYRKDGTPFPNLVTVIPIPGGVSGGAHEENDVVFHVGFQVDLTEQPNAILEKLRNGSYLVDYSAQPFLSPGYREFGGGAGGSSREKRATNIPKIVISKEMRMLLNDPGFVKSIPVTTAANHPPPASTSSGGGGGGGDVQQDPSSYGGNHPLHLMLLETGPDFIHVVSLKGTFLYVAPSVRRVLGYEPEDLAGKSISDLAHPEDVVPLMRELKESSTTGISAAGEGGVASSVHTVVQPRTVDLLFRARTKNGAYVWVESRGRLYAEPGKGRKAIILSGRAKEIPKLMWGMVARGGGLAKMAKVKRRVTGDGGGAVEEVDVFQEFWGTLSNSMVMLMIGKGFQDVLGWSPEEWKGRNLKQLLVDGGGLDVIVKKLGAAYGSGVTAEAQVVRTRCTFRHEEGRVVDAFVNVYRCERDPLVMAATKSPGAISPAPLIYQVRLVGAETYPLTGGRRASVDLGANMFEELEISRGSSWQYELQQLKYANQRLKDDVAVLEAAARVQQQQRYSSSASGVGQGVGGSRGSYLQPRQQQQQRPWTSGGMPYFTSAALPARAASMVDRSGGVQQQQQQQQLQRGGSLGMNGGGGGRPVLPPLGEWTTSLDPSPFVQRIREEVQSSTRYVPSGTGTGSAGSSGVPLKRSWGGVDGPAIAR